MKWMWVILMCLMVSCVSSEGNVTDGAEEDPVETFEQAEKNLKADVGNVIKKLLPHLLRGGSEAKISGPCTSSIMKIIGGVRQLKEWALRFIDATGKIPSGILEGTSVSLGDYDECLDIEVGKKDVQPKKPDDVLFRGQYCLLENHRPESIQRAIDDFQNGNKETPISKTKTFLNMLVKYKHLTNSTFKLGICVPSKCTEEDVRNILSSETLRPIGKIEVSYCEVKEEKEKTNGELILLCVVGIFVIFMIVGTVLDMYFRLINESTQKEKTKPLTCLQKVISNSSIYGNAIKVLSTKNYHENLSCLCAIRPIVVILIIYGHTYGHLNILHFQKFSKAVNFTRFFESFFFSGIANASVGVDTISFLAAVTITYNGWRYLQEKEKAKFSLIKVFFLRYFRLSSAQLVTTILFLLFPLLGSGPLWHGYTGQPLEMCRKNWWMNFLYINNFMKSTEICLYHTWILALVMQLTLLGVIITWVLKKSSKFGTLLMILIIISGIVGVGAMTIIHQLPGSLAFFMHDHKSFPIAWRDIYLLPYDHMGPFCIGLSVGYFLALKKDKLEISKLTSMFLWCLSLGCNIAVMFGLYGYRHGDKMNLSLSTFYAVMNRNVWALGIGWIVIACTTHHAGPVSRVLKAKIFVPLDRLCYLAYLLHIPIMFFHSGVTRDTWFMGHLEMFFLSIAYSFVSFLCAFFVYIFFASPYFALEEHILSLFIRKKKENVKPTNGYTPRNVSVITLEDTNVQLTA
ncbi:nose resistant to fluoxetine protein 6 [Parasteatoda tepidariorum]|uniref:nose resistant to fluoxetine protein 6 n=1 Tax=Parasteatoda tepidariorum TaxID=114398 RepID=UPI001C7215A6|nr:nose resistant to fluoxetine protein 6 [Parasteatoda tepidariorum]